MKVRKCIAVVLLSCALGATMSTGVQATSPAASNSDSTERKIYTDKEIIKQVQEALNERGYDCGSPDGIVGKNTANAIQSYKKEHSLAENSDVDEDLLNALGIEIPSETSSVGMPISDFVTRYNEIADQYNALDDSFAGTHITEDMVKKDSFSPEGVAEIKVVLTNNAVTEISLDSTLTSYNLVTVMGEGTSLLYAFDDSLNNFSEAIDMFGNLMDSTVITKDNSMYTLVSIGNDISMTGNYYAAYTPQTSEKDYDSVIESLKSLIGSDSIKFDDTISQDGAIGYPLKYKNIDLGLTFEEINGKTSLSVTPTSALNGDEASQNYMTFLSYIIQAVDPSLEFYDAMTIVAKVGDGTYEENNISYNLDMDTLIFTINY